MDLFEPINVAKRNVCVWERCSSFLSLKKICKTTLECHLNFFFGGGVFNQNCLDNFFFISSEPFLAENSWNE